MCPLFAVLGCGPVCHPLFSGPLFLGCLILLWACCDSVTSVKLNRMQTCYVVFYSPSNFNFDFFFCVCVCGLGLEGLFVLFFIIVIIPVPSAQLFIRKPLIGEGFVVFHVWGGMGWPSTQAPAASWEAPLGLVQSIRARFGKCLLHPQGITGSSVRGRNLAFVLDPSPEPHRWGAALAGCVQLQLSASVV